MHNMVSLSKAVPRYGNSLVHDANHSHFELVITH